MRLQNARNLGGGSLICATAGADGDAAYLLGGGSTVKVTLGGENRGKICYGRAVVLRSGRVMRTGGKLHYESV